MIKRYTTPLLFVLGLVVGSVATAVVAVADQPHMRNALTALYTAQSELTAASTNKAGHRVNALNDVNNAIVEVKAGIAAGGNY
jgi:hypothetical protein